VEEIQRALLSYKRQAALHRQKMSSLETFVQDWVRKSPRAQQGLLRHWQQDLICNQELADVMRGILQERGIQ
jgi:hypothetical protein